MILNQSLFPRFFICSLLMLLGIGIFLPYSPVEGAEKSLVQRSKETNLTVLEEKKLEKDLDAFRKEFPFAPSVGGSEAERMQSVQDALDLGYDPEKIADFDDSPEALEMWEKAKIKRAARKKRIEDAKK